MTNSEKFNNAMAAINEKSKAFVDDFFNGKVPNQFYRVCMKTYKPVPVKINRVFCLIPYFERGKSRVSKDQLKKIIVYLESMNDFCPEDIRIEYTEEHKTYTSTGWYKIDDIAIDKGKSYNCDDLLCKCAELKMRYELKEGDISCDYCRKAFPEKEKVIYRVISYANYGPAGKTGNYCSRECSMHDQMAHEG